MLSSVIGVGGSTKQLSTLKCDQPAFSFKTIKNASCSFDKGLSWVKVYSLEGIDSNETEHDSDSLSSFRSTFPISRLFFFVITIGEPLITFALSIPFGRPL